ncbi:9663_t:CDS:2 [Cetraspora pellucida]|uniref:9663_t:CDS:1 n=1 Tax=Cetraspora pellucida TaxID=1433469 RepID=A0ACA9MVP2_9GLOM|nr:9663_t:CDS:2 [Cetraspora pellucida]
MLNKTNTNKVKRQTIETEKAKRIILTKVQKAKLCHLHKSRYTQLLLANHFKIGKSTVLKILKQEDYWLSIDPNSIQAKSKRDHSAKYPQLEEVLKLIEDFDLVDLTLPRSQELEGINHTDLVTEIQSLISQLPVTNPMQAENFIKADHSIEMDIMPSDNEIITAILDRDCNEDDENEPEVHISYKEVITSINNILHFIDQEDRFKVDRSFVQKLNRFKKDVVRDSIAKKRQTTIDLYMQN